MQSAGAISGLSIWSAPDSEDKGLEEDKMSFPRFLEIVGFKALKRWLEFCKWRLWVVGKTGR